MILVDTSVWVEHLRRTRSRAHVQFRALVTTDPASIATCERADSMSYAVLFHTRMFVAPFVGKR